jgi:hypothetical protein
MSGPNTPKVGKPLVTRAGCAYWVTNPLITLTAGGLLEGSGSGRVSGGRVLTLGTALVGICFTSAPPVSLLHLWDRLVVPAASPLQLVGLRGRRVDPGHGLVNGVEDLGGWALLRGS